MFYYDKSKAVLPSYQINHHIFIDKSLFFFDKCNNKGYLAVFCIDNQPLNQMKIPQFSSRFSAKKGCFLTPKNTPPVFVPGGKQVFIRGKHPKPTRPNKALFTAFMGPKVNAPVAAPFWTIIKSKPISTLIAMGMILTYTILTTVMLPKKKSFSWKWRTKKWVEPAWISSSPPSHHFLWWGWWALPLHFR